ncbi:hypothetical protein [Methanolacinia petrolearia]|uniref:hypothetical protein n=1 Tax=Methanolacinia petrolearia TaxID=54120 RepID=UPI003BA8896C
MKESSGLKSVTALGLVLVVILIVLSAFVLETAFGSSDEGNAEEIAGYSGDLRVLTTPDIHSHLFSMSDNDTGTRIGRIGSLAETLGEMNESTIYLFAGDLGEGGFYHMYSGVPEVEAYSMAGIDAAVLGNHAFDFNNSLLKVWATNASFPIL